MFKPKYSTVDTIEKYGRLALPRQAETNVQRAIMISFGWKCSWKVAHCMST
jgi:hypothetical protein